MWRLMCQDQLLGTVAVSPVTHAENSLISQSISGYLGSAYRFTAAEQINNAVITFCYDQRLLCSGINSSPVFITSILRRSALRSFRIRIITPDGGYAYIEVLSDPTIKDTDGDGYDDYEEEKSMGTDPKADTYDGSAVNDLRTMWFTVLLPCLSWWRKINMNQDIMTALLHWELCHLPHRKKYIRVFGWII